MTYEELYRLHYANGDMALAAIYNDLCEQSDIIKEKQKLIDELDNKVFRYENPDLF